MLVEYTIEAFKDLGKDLYKDFSQILLIAFAFCLCLGFFLGINYIDKQNERKVVMSLSCSEIGGQPVVIWDAGPRIKLLANAESNSGTISYIRNDQTFIPLPGQICQTTLHSK